MRVYSSYNTNDIHLLKFICGKSLDALSNTLVELFVRGGFYTSFKFKEAVPYLQFFFHLLFVASVVLHFGTNTDLCSSLQRNNGPLNLKRGEN